MATLSKMVIENIAERMTAKSKQHAKSLKAAYEQLATDIYEDQVPEDVKKVFKKYPEYIETTRSLYVNGHGFNREYVNINKSLPATTSYNMELKLTAAIAEKLVKAKRSYEKAQEDFDLLLRETEQALMTLKTQKNIRENLPEAIPFLPPPMSNSLVVNFDSLKKKLGKQPEVKELVAK